LNRNCREADHTSQKRASHRRRRYRLIAGVDGSEDDRR
jgi:hypothetical protein